MGNKIGILALSLCMALVVVSCGKPPPPPQPQPTQTQQAPQQQPPATQPQQTKIKGFYIGMPAAEVVNTLSSLGLTTISRSGEVITVEIPRMGGTVENGNSKSFSYFYLDSATYGNLTELTIDGYTVDVLFNSGGMNEREFADNLSDAYKLPHFDFRLKPDGGCEYKCVTPDGLKITVSGDKGHEKDLDVSASTDSAVKKNFN